MDKIDFLEGEIKNLKERIEKLENISYFSTFPVKMKDFIILEGPGSITCDRTGAKSIEDCKECWGTGSCTYGKEV